jgi:hypothetical protein
MESQPFDNEVDDSDMQTQAYEAAEEDPLPPRLQDANDPESEDMEKGCALPVPEVGAKIMVLGRQTLESASALGTFYSTL